MKATVTTKDLLPLAYRLSKIVSKSISVEELKSVLMEADDDAGELTLTATDLNVLLRVTIKAAVEEPGSTLFSAEYFNKTVQAVAGDKILFESDEKHLIIESGSAHYIYCVLPGSSFPKYPLPEPETFYQISNICSLARRTIFAAVENMEHPTLKCIDLRFHGNELVTSASDGSRLMVAHSAASGKSESELLIPAKSFRLLSAISADTDQFQVGADGKYAVFKKPELIFTCKLEPGTYMNTQSLISNTNPIFGAKLDAKIVANVMESILTLAEPSEPFCISYDEKGLDFTFDGKNGHVSMFTDAQMVVKEAPEHGFYYLPHKMKENLCAFSGTITMLFSKRGELVLKGKNEFCLQIPSAAPKNLKKAKKSTKRKAA